MTVETLADPAGSQEPQCCRYSAPAELEDDATLGGQTDRSDANTSSMTEKDQREAAFVIDVFGVELVGTPVISLITLFSGYSVDRTETSWYSDHSSHRFLYLHLLVYPTLYSLKFFVD